MFGIPGKQAVSITDKAAAQIAKLMTKDGSQGLRIGVKKGGCAGMEYTMDYVSEIDPMDEVVEQDGARVMIAPMAQMFLFGKSSARRGEFTGSVSMRLDSPHMSLSPLTPLLSRPVILRYRPTASRTLGKRDE